MESAVSLDVDTVLLELQTVLLANNVITSDDLQSVIPRPNLVHDVKQIIDEIARAKRQNRTLVVEYLGNSPIPKRFKISPMSASRSSNVFSFILEKVYRLLLTNSTATRREIYYQNVSLFSKQEVVDRTVDKICQIFNVPQWDLGVLATSKGLVHGPLNITLKNGELIDCAQQQGGTLIPQNLQQGAYYETTAKFGLIIEKDAAFQNLLSTGIRSITSSCILITGKGYPDMNTRFLVKDLSTKLSLPMFVIVDADPYGIDIFFNYKYGSKAKVYINQHFAAPQVFWLGIHPSDMNDLVPSPLQSLTTRDVAKARKLFKRQYVRDEERINDQIKILLRRGQKCEIENISSISLNYLSEVYIPTKISRKKFI